MITKNRRWITIIVTILLALSAFFWSPYLFDLYMRLYTNPEKVSPKTLLLKKYMERKEKCPDEELDIE